MAVLVPVEEGVADAVSRRLPGVEVVRYGVATPADLAAVTFYCLPYMGGADSVALVSRLPALQVVQSLSSGVDDVLPAVPAQVTLCNGRGLGHEEGTAELAVLLMLASTRRLPQFVVQQQQRRWRHVRTDTLEGKRVLLVGYGAIGQAVDRRLVAFGVEVTRVSRSPRDGVAPLSRLAELATRADVLVVCIALTGDTRGLVGAEVLAALPTGALVVNVARGPVVDPAALLDEVGRGRLRAALDVTEPEPLSPDRPEWSTGDVLITPHVGGDTVGFARRAADFVVEQVDRHVAGQPLANVVRGPAGPG